MFVVIAVTKIIPCFSTKPEVIVTCETCERSGPGFSSQSGETLRITYTVNTDDFTLLTIQYGGPENVINIIPSKFSVRDVTDQRLSLRKRDLRGKQIYEIILRDVRTDDDGRRFEYEYQNQQLELVTGENVLRVRDEETGGRNSGGGSGLLTRGCTCVVQLLLIFLVSIFFILG